VREGVLPVAVKTIHRAALDGERAAEMRKELLHECAVLRMLSTGPNILHFMVRMICWCNSVNSLQCQCPCCVCGVENAHMVQVRQGADCHLRKTRRRTMPQGSEQCLRVRSWVQGVCVDGGQPKLVTELCTGGDLSSAIQRRVVTWQKRCAWPSIMHIVNSRCPRHALKNARFVSDCMPRMPRPDARLISHLPCGLGVESCT